MNGVDDGRGDTGTLGALGADTAPPSPVEPVVRLRAWGRWLSVLEGIAVTTMNTALLVTLPRATRPAFFLPVVVTVGVVTLGLVVRAVVGTVAGEAVLDGEGYRSRVRIRRVRVAWRDVTVLTTEKVKGAARLVAYLHDGTRVLLPFPQGPADVQRRKTRRADAFWRQVAVVGRHWEAHRAVPERS